MTDDSFIRTMAMAECNTERKRTGFPKDVMYRHVISVQYEKYMIKAK